MAGHFTGGPVQGVEPTGKRGSSSAACDCFEIKDGKIVGNTAYYDGASFARQVGMLPAAGLRRGAGDEGRVQRVHQDAPAPCTRVGRQMSSSSHSRSGLVWWITAWAFGIKAFDAFLLTAALVVGAAAWQIMKPFVSQALRRDTPDSAAAVRLLAEERAATVVLDSGTVRSSATASASGTSSIAVPRSAAILPQRALVGGVDGGHSERRGQHAVEGGRRAAALGVPEHGRARLVAGAPLDLALEPLSDAAQPGMAELVLAAGDQLHRALHRDGALGHDHDREVAPALVAAPDQPAHLLDVERPLGDRGSRRRRRPAPNEARSSRRGGP